MNRLKQLLRVSRVLPAYLCCLFFLVSSASATPFKIGVSIPLSGNLAEFGVAVRNAIELYRNSHQEECRNLSFVYEDDRYEPKLTISAFNKLADLENIDLFFVWGNEPALGVAPVVERRQIPMVAVAQHPKAGAGYKYIIRFTNPAEDWSKALVTYLRKQGYKNYGVIQSELSFYNILLDEFRKNLLPGENLTIIESLSPSDMDFRTDIAKLKGKAFDAVGVYLLTPQLIQFARQANEQGFSASYFGPTVFESKAVIGQALSYVNGAVFSHMKVSEPFKNEYMAAYRNDTQISYAANAYDFARVSCGLFNGLQKKPTAEEILAAYSQVPPGEGAAGHYQYKDNETYGKYFEFEIAVKKIKDDKIVVVD